MTRALLVAGAVCLALVWLGTEATAGEDQKAKPLTFQVYDSYFESNKSGLEGASSYLVFTDKESFGKVFRPTPPLGGKKRTYLPDNAFASNVVAAAVKRGNRIWNYKVTGVELCKGKATVRYEAKAGPEGSARFASPLIVRLPGAGVSRVIFEENGKEVATVKLQGK
jgi:hypothetical protein